MQYRAVISRFDTLTKQRYWAFIRNQEFTVRGATYIVPAYYWFNGASIPRPFWSAFSPTGNAFHASALHDWLYDTQGQGLDRIQALSLSRADVDAIFYCHLREDGVSKLQAYIFHFAVSSFGLGHWQHDSRPAYLNDPDYYQQFKALA